MTTSDRRADAMSWARRGWQRAYLVDPGVVAELRALRGPGESYSDVILRLPDSAA